MVTPTLALNASDCKSDLEISLADESTAAEQEVRSCFDKTKSDFATGSTFQQGLLKSVATATEDVKAALYNPDVSSAKLNIALAKWCFAQSDLMVEVSRQVAITMDSGYRPSSHPTPVEFASLPRISAGSGPSIAYGSEKHDWMASPSNPKHMSFSTYDGPTESLVAPANLRPKIPFAVGCTSKLKVTPEGMMPMWKGEVRQASQASTEDLSNGVCRNRVSAVATKLNEGCKSRMATWYPKKLQLKEGTGHGNAYEQFVAHEEDCRQSVENGLTQAKSDMWSGKDALFEKPIPVVFDP